MKNFSTRCLTQVGVTAFVLFGAAGCATPTVYLHPVKNIKASSLYFRRPNYPQANPTASVGGVDYRTVTDAKGLGENLGCIEPSSVFESISNQKVYDCLGTITEFQELMYVLKRVDQPYFELDTTVLPPEFKKGCWVQVLGKIPVPREIVFQAPVEVDLSTGRVENKTNQPESGNEGGAELDQFSCFSSVLSLSDDELLGVKVPMAQVNLKISLPLSSELTPDSPEAVSRLLTSWVMTAFQSAAPNGDHIIVSKVLPDSVCKKCMGDEEFYDSNPANVTQWPEAPPAH